VVILRGRWCGNIVLKVHAPTEDKIDDMQDSFYDELERVLDKFPKYHMKTSVDFSAKAGREEIFKPTIGTESLHEFSNVNGVRVGARGSVMVKALCCKLESRGFKSR
jgi:hypothetical protein